jgi:hypothetical protein
MPNCGCHQSLAQREYVPAGTTVAQVVAPDLSPVQGVRPALVDVPVPQQVAAVETETLRGQGANRQTRASR